MPTDDSPSRVAGMADLLPSASGAPDEDGVMQHSPNAIADALGVSRPTVLEDIEELVSGYKLKAADKVRGQDGKAYPAKRGGDVLRGAESLFKSLGSGGAGVPTSQGKQPAPGRPRAHPGPRGPLLCPNLVPEVVENLRHLTAGHVPPGFHLGERYTDEQVVVLRNPRIWSVSGAERSPRTLVFGRRLG